MSLGPHESTEVRRLGRAGPSTSEMELLRAATLGPEAASGAWRRWIATHEVDDASDRAVGLLAAVGANVPVEALGAEAGRLRGLRRRSWADTQLRLAVAAEALDVLGAAGRTPIVTGGASLLTTSSTTAAAAAGTRPLGSIDLVLDDTVLDDTVLDDHDPIAAAVGALESAGWARVRPVDSPFDHIIDVVDPAGRPIRLHRWVLFPRLAAEPERAWAQRALPHELAGRSVRRFRPADELVATLLLGLLIPTAGVLRWPLDVVDLAQAGPAEAGDAVFWSDVTASAVELGAGPVVAAALAMCRVDLDAAIPADVVDELTASPCDPALARHWMLRRLGLVPERRMLRYRRVAHQSGDAATPWGYVRARTVAARATGLRTAARTRIERGRLFAAGLRRD